jgi:hypothetical protein
MGYHLESLFEKTKKVTGKKQNRPEYFCMGLIYQTHIVIARSKATWQSVAGA